MAPRFETIKFNLLRAIEFLQDMNHEDMDVTAQPSDYNDTKERQVAEKLDQCLNRLIVDGFFDDCDPRSEEGDENSEEISTPESGGFEFSPSHSDDGASRGSFASRFKRYVRRMLPGGSSRSRGHSAPEEEGSHSEMTTDYSEEDDGATGQSGSERSQSASRRSQSSRASSRSAGSRRLAQRASRSRERLGRPVSHGGSSRQSSRSHRRERSGSEPFDPNVVYEHSHHHKHNHPGPHHHHGHSADGHQHTYHRHPDEEMHYSSNDGISGVYRADSNDDLGSVNSGGSRTASTSAGRRRRSASGQRRSTSRTR